MSATTKYLGVFAVVCAGIGLAQPVHAEPANAPNAYFVLGGGIFENGQSQNIGPSAQKVLDEGLYWFDGTCPHATDGRRHCDLLRFGASLFPATCNDGSPAEMSHYLPPAEDGGQAVQDALKNIQRNSVSAPYCESDTSYRPVGEALLDHQRELFNGTRFGADSPWQRPNLNLLVLEDMPQTRDGANPAAHAADERAKRAIGATCDMLYGFDGVANANWPAMPTWVMMAREHTSEAAAYGGVLAAAGGTGVCCYDESYDANDPEDEPCDPTDPSQRIDVCGEFSNWSETEIRHGVASGKFQCAPGDAYVQTGSMDFGGDTKGTQPHLLCHFSGENGHSNCTGPTAEQNHRRPTDVLGKMACVRQVPRDYDGGAIQYCDRHGNCRTLIVCDDDIDDDGTDNPDDPCPFDVGYDDASSCPTSKTVDECSGVEFIDPNKTLFSLRGVDVGGEYLCQGLSEGGTVEVVECPREGESCTVSENLDGSPAYGRCSIGEIYCDDSGQEKCRQLYNPMPEICNGLDDDCNVEIDNLSTSWDASEFSGYDPTELDDFDSDGVDRTAIHCWERNVCSCQGGTTLDYGGPGYSGHIMSWQPGTCICGEGMTARTPDRSSGGLTPAPPASAEPQAGCSTALGDSVTGNALAGNALIAKLLALLFGGLTLLLCRRRATER